jgi:hypothetical protein
MPMNGLAFLEMPTSPIATNKRKRKNETMAKANSQSKRRVVLAKTPQSPEIVTGDSPSAEKANEPDEIQSCAFRTQPQYVLGPLLTRGKQAQWVLCGISSTYANRLSQSGQMFVRCITLYEICVV